MSFRKLGREVDTFVDRALKGFNEPLSPSPSPTTEQTTFEFETPFIPNQPQVNATNSVVLEVSKMTPYLDKAIKGLGLHTEARTSFITYVHHSRSSNCRAS